MLISQDLKHNYFNVSIISRTYYQKKKNHIKNHTTAQKENKDQDKNNTRSITAATLIH